MPNSNQATKSALQTLDEINEILTADELADIVVDSIEKRLTMLRNYLENGDNGEVTIKAQIKELKIIKGFIGQVMKKKEAAVKQLLELAINSKGD